MSGAINGFNIRVEREIEEVIDSFDYVLYDIPEPVLFAKTDGQAEKAIAKYNWQRLNFSPLITDSFQAFSSLSNLEECVAVHVRRGDLLNKLRHESVEDLLKSGATEIFQRYIPMKTICDILLHKFPGLKTCIICSESRDIANQLGRLQPKIDFIHSASAYSQNCNQRALLDLLILANAAYTVAPFKSYFSSCAETVGRCKLINSSLDIPNLVEELTQALDNLDSPDLKTRRAIVYAYGYLNLWYEPQSQLRHKLKEMTFSEDSDIGNLLLDQDE
ncbi:MAG: hypothetical protein EBZ48_00025 [Proteobacteria bacterium]|nr:hypothetical protein [Pseudomonadota bacterium]